MAPSVPAFCGDSWLRDELTGTVKPLKHPAQSGSLLFAALSAAADFIPRVAGSSLETTTRGNGSRCP
jgi:hypothetical protein